MEWEVGVGIGEGGRGGVRGGVKGGVKGEDAASRNSHMPAGVCRACAGTRL